MSSAINMLTVKMDTIVKKNTHGHSNHTVKNKIQTMSNAKKMKNAHLLLIVGMFLLTIR